jgi:hypothetical protein
MGRMRQRREATLTQSVEALLEFFDRLNQAVARIRIVDPGPDPKAASGRCRARIRGRPIRKQLTYRRGGTTGKAAGA